MSKSTDVNIFDDLMKDPNIAMIIVGALVWLVGPYIPLLGPIITTAGFILTIIACATNAANRPEHASIPGMIIGSIVYIIGLYLSWIPFVGYAVQVFGGVLLLFFGTSFALKVGLGPVLEEIRKQASREKEETTIDVEPEDVSERETQFE